MTVRLLIVHSLYNRRLSCAQHERDTRAGSATASAFFYRTPPSHFAVENHSPLCSAEMLRL